MPNYFPLHVHSHYSLLDGLSKPSQIAKRIQEIGVAGSALTDHGSISGVVQFISAMKNICECGEQKSNHSDSGCDITKCSKFISANLKPVLGCELYISKQSATIRTKENMKLTHLPVLAKNNQGWTQLIKLTSESNKPEHVYRKPRLSLDELATFLDGNVIGFSGHMGSHIANAIYDYDNDKIKSDAVKEATALALNMQDKFGKGNFFLEVQLMDHRNTKAQEKLTDVIREISSITKIPCIATPDAHYARKEDAYDQRVLLCTNMNKTMKQCNDPNFGLSTFFQSDNFHIPSAQEMLDYGHKNSELENTLLIADQIEEYTNILNKPVLPEFECPKNFDADMWMRELCRKGWKNLVQNKVPKADHEKYRKRIAYELGVLQGAGLSPYFLIVQDIIQHGINKGWLMGPGRGSAAGCLCSYLMNITAIDPMPYGLLFERFYNAGRNTEDRVALPDIDIDVPVTKREEIIQYIRDKYGDGNVSQIVTFQTMKGRGAIKDVLRAWGGTSFEEMNAITKNIPEESKIAGELQQMKEATGESSILRWSLENRASKFKDWCYLDDQDKLQGPLSRRFEQAIRLEGTKSAQSKHAAGLVISPQPLANICPMIITKDKDLVAGFEMEDLEASGLPKFDVLGIAMLSKTMGISNILKSGNIDT